MHKRLAVLVSGRGTNLQAIIDAVENGSLEMEVVGVFSDQPDPYAFHRARKKGIPTVFVNPKDYSKRKSMMLPLPERLLHLIRILLH